MEIYSGDLSRFESTAFGTNGRSDRYALAVARIREADGFLPQIDPINPPTVDQIRQTLESQEILTKAERGEVMVPDRWVDLRRIAGTRFRKGHIDGGIVVAVDLQPIYRDTRQDQATWNILGSEARRRDGMTNEDFIRERSSIK